jgi:hypothetical protein
MAVPRLSPLTDERTVTAPETFWPPTVIDDPFMFSVSTGRPLEPLAAAELDVSASAPAAASGAPAAKRPQASFLDMDIAMNLRLVGGLR